MLRGIVRRPETYWRVMLRAGILLAAGMGLILSGCSVLDLGKLTGAGTESRARQALLDGDYDAARDLYEQMADKAASPGSRQAGAFGLACVNLAVAGDLAAYQAALAAILKTPAGPAKGDLALMRPGLMRGLALAAAADRDAADRLARCRTEQAQLRQEVEKLSRQILALENIDLEHQEKRKNQ